MSYTALLFHKFGFWRKKVSPGYLSLCSIIPAAAATSTTCTNLKRAAVLYFNMDWVTKKPNYSHGGVSSAQWGHAEASDGWTQWLNSLISLCCKQIKQKNNNDQHAAQDYTSLWCCASLHGVRGEKEPLMHLISVPLESSSSYRCPCPSRRDIQSRKCSGGAD